MELTEEQKYAKKAEMLKRALAAADEMDKKDEAKAKAQKLSEKAKRHADRTKRDAEAKERMKQAAKDGEPVL